MVKLIVKTLNPSSLFAGRMWAWRFQAGLERKARDHKRVADDIFERIQRRLHRYIPDQEFAKADTKPRVIRSGRFSSTRTILTNDQELIRERKMLWGSTRKVFKRDQTSGEFRFARMETSYSGRHTTHTFEDGRLVGVTVKKGNRYEDTWERDAKGDLVQTFFYSRPRIGRKIQHILKKPDDKGYRTLVEKVGGRTRFFERDPKGKLRSTGWVKRFSHKFTRVDEDRRAQTTWTKSWGGLVTRAYRSHLDPDGTPLDRIDTFAKTPWRKIEAAYQENGERAWIKERFFAGLATKSVVYQDSKKTITTTRLGKTWSKPRVDLSEDEVALQSRLRELKGPVTKSSIDEGSGQTERSPGETSQEMTKPRENPGPINIVDMMRGAVETTPPVAASQSLPSGHRRAGPQLSSARDNRLSIDSRTSSLDSEARAAFDEAARNDPRYASDVPPLSVASPLAPVSRPSQAPVAFPTMHRQAPDGTSNASASHSSIASEISSLDSEARAAFDEAARNDPRYASDVPPLSEAVSLTPASRPLQYPRTVSSIRRSSSLGSIRSGASSNVYDKGKGKMPEEQVRDSRRQEIFARSSLGENEYTA